MQEIQLKLNELLMSQYPEQEKRDEVIATMGELIISETLVNIIEAITDLAEREKFVAFVNGGNVDEAVKVAENVGLDIYAILEAKSKEVLSEVAGE